MNLCVDDIEKFGRLFKPRRKFVTIAFRNVCLETPPLMPLKPPVRY